MTDFSVELRDFAAELERDVHDIRHGIAHEVRRSVTVGSELTGAPGQPVDIGALRASWTDEIGEDHSETSTNIVYAPAIEDGVGQYGPLTLRSEVGGFHSVALTVASFDRIVEHVVAEVSK